ncbi:hypothetical protein [Hoyosella altamirensis]|uniref:DUF998 domain-containing protein n=1 Tax=Hoyosella altamirensis TaxID=616997 RepID=A0A839RLP5_9ACTN|nr:hypothetical protein [Hoyosella altamirensis]MBB3037118.1 hypothetical protein [Hoyosella altamirensis]
MNISVEKVPAQGRAGTTLASRLRIFGLTCFVAALLGAASGIYLAVAAQTPAVSEDMWSYPQSPGAFAVTQVWFAIQHLGLLLGLLGLLWSGATGASRTGRWGCYAALAGMAGLTVAEIAAVTARFDTMTTTLVAGLGAVYGVTSIVIGAGLVAAGVAVRKARIWGGWRSWVPLAAGVWVFAPMMPALAMSFVGARLAITGWMLLFAALGWTLLHPNKPHMRNRGRS